MNPASVPMPMPVMNNMPDPTAVVAAGCFPLMGTKTCPDLGNYYIMMDAMDGITDVNSFDAYMMSMGMENSTTYINSFQQTYGCPGFAGHGIRYFISTGCYFFVQTSQNKCGQFNPMPVQPLCQSSCLNYVNSVTSLFNTSSVCSAMPTPDQQMNRTTFMTPGTVAGQTDLFYQWCSTLDATGTVPCSQGVALETANLGFFYSADTLAYCGGKMVSPADAMSCTTALNSFYDVVVALLKPANNLYWQASGIAWAAMIFIYLFFIASIAMRSWRKASNSAVAIFPATEKPKDSNYKGTIARNGQAPVEKRVSMFAKPSKPDFSRDTNAFKEMSMAPPGRGLGDSDESSLLVKMVCVENYMASLPDECTIQVRDVVVVEEMFDDGWGVVRNESSGVSGVVPLSCLAPMNGKGANNRRKSGARTASLYINRN